MKDLLPELFFMTMLIALKLDGYLEMSWIWVLSPIWVSILMTMLVTIYAFIAAEREAKKSYKPYIAQGNRLYWDANTQTMYGDCEKELTIE